jgi:hypothetical protein
MNDNRADQVAISHCENGDHGIIVETPTTAAQESVVPQITTPLFRFPRPERESVDRRRFRRGKNQLRHDPSSLTELTESLKRDGQLYPVYAVKTGEFVAHGEVLEILDGQRRFDASESIPELQQLDCYVFQPGIRDEQLIAFQLIVDVTRENLSAADRARAMFQLFKLSRAKTINEFVTGDHGLSVGEVWLRNLILVGEAEQSGCVAKREIFQRVQHGKLGIASASKHLAGTPKTRTKRGPDRPPRTESSQEFTVAEQYQIPLTNYGGRGEWFLAVIAPKRGAKNAEDCPIDPRALKAAAKDLLLRASKDDN